MARDYYINRAKEEFHHKFPEISEIEIEIERHKKELEKIRIKRSETLFIWILTIIGPFACYPSVGISALLLGYITKSNNYFLIIFIVLIYVLTARWIYYMLGNGK